MTNKVIIGIVIAIVIALGAFWLFRGSGNTPQVGTAVNCQNNTCFTSLGVTGAFQADGASIFNSTVTLGSTLAVTGNATVSGGTLTLTSTNAATSSLIVGCKQSTATSTATPIKELYTLAAQGAGVATGTSAGVTSAGNVVWAYGTCP